MSSILTPQAKKFSKHFFQKKVIDFYLQKGRSYPWRQSKDPYKILVAEILLRRTGARKVKEIYEKIISMYPNVRSMSKAKVDLLREMLRPLGLLRRAELLITVSLDIVNRFEDQVPNDFQSLISIKGVGRYTANAVLNLAYGQSVPLVDESVKRIFKACLGLKSNKGADVNEELWQMATKMLPKHKVREYNLGLLDIGAKFCGFRLKKCEECPLKAIEQKPFPKNKQ